MSKNKKKLVIVSSYKRPCGIAQYVEHLEVPLHDIAADNGWDVEIIPIPVTKFRAKGGYAKKMAKKELKEMCRRVARADVVNIQLEPGLFGRDIFAIWSRLNAVINASKKVLLTYHTVPNMNTFVPFSLRPKELQIWLKSYHGNLIFKRLFAKILWNKSKFIHIVQTKREALNFSLMGIKENKIYAFPLAFLTTDLKKQYHGNSIRKKIDKQYGFAPDSKLIGCFGFLSSYKGIEIAVQAISQLPENYHLLVVGGLHPEGIKMRTVSQPYIKTLTGLVTTGYVEDEAGANMPHVAKAINLLDRTSRTLAGDKNEKNNVQERIHFLGAPKNEKFNQIMQACDGVVLHYAEVGQTSSGPAAIALDLEKPLYCAHNRVFNELAKFAPEGISFSEIGNYLELAQKIQIDDGNTDERVEARKKYTASYNVEERAKIYIDACQNLVGS